MLCGEGPHDVGRIEQWSIKKQTQVVEEGWLQPLLKKYAYDEGIEFEIVPRARLVKLPGPQKAPLPSGHGAKAFIAKFRAKSSNCDAVVFMLDGDTSADADWKGKLAEVQSGFDLVTGDTISIACVPKSTSESWLLSDEQAWNAVSGQNVDLPEKPEELWGLPNDAESSHPKSAFVKTCEKAGLTNSTETRRALMEAASVETLRQKCPLSFQAFDLAAGALSSNS